MRKKIFSLVLTCWLYCNIHSQILNAGFEDTIVVQSQLVTGQHDSIPKNWSLAYPAAGARITNDAFSGSRAVQLWSWYFGQSNGELIYGNEYHWKSRGMPISNRPEKLLGYYKFDMVNSINGQPDSALAEVYLFKYNAQLGQRDTIGFGKLHLGEQTVYTSFEIQIEYLSPSTPDTVSIYFRSSVNQWTNCNEDGGGNCNYLYIDDLSFTAPSGIEYPVTDNNLFIYPNPFSTMTTLRVIDSFKDATLSVYNSLGREVKQFKNISTQTIYLHRDDLPAGLYIIRHVRDDKITNNHKLVITE